MEYGLIGKNLKYSFSKEIHERLAGYSYELCEVKPEELEGFLKCKNFKAINVTMPYKKDVIPYLDEMDAVASKTCVVNTIVNRDGKLCGYNTDYFGLSLLISRAGILLAGKKVLILGSGATSRTAAAVAEGLGAESVFRVSRKARPASDLLDENTCIISYEDAISMHSDADVIINTTPVGMHPDIDDIITLNGTHPDIDDIITLNGTHPDIDGETIALDLFPNLSGVIDVVYNPIHTRLILNARKKNVPAASGLYMLVAQAVAAAELFVKDKISHKKIDEIYSAILREKQNIVLIGMPGAGKTTIGKLIAKKTGREFIDTDEEIVKCCGSSSDVAKARGEIGDNAKRYEDAAEQSCKTIAKIFANEGEEAFRGYEEKAVLNASLKTGAVIATGGGVVLNPENIIRLKANGIIFFIDRDISEITPSDERPLAQDVAAIEKCYEERHLLYEKYGIRVENKSVTEAAAEILKEFTNENISD